MNEITADKIYINDKTFWNYFRYHKPLILSKDLIRAKEAKNEQLVNNINDELIDWKRNEIVRKEIPKKKSNKVVDIV